MEGVDPRDRALLVVAEVEALAEAGRDVGPEDFADAVRRNAVSRHDETGLWLAVHRALLERGYDLPPPPAGARWAWLGAALSAALVVLLGELARRLVA